MTGSTAETQKVYFKSISTYNLSSNPFLYVEEKPQEFTYSNSGGSVKSACIPYFMASFYVSASPDATTPVPQGMFYLNPGFIYCDQSNYNSNTYWLTVAGLTNYSSYIHDHGLNDQTKIRFTVLIPKY